MLDFNFREPQIAEAFKRNRYDIQKKVNMRDKDKREEVGKNILPPNKVVTTL